MPPSFQSLCDGGKKNPNFIDCHSIPITLIEYHKVKKHYNEVEKKEKINFLTPFTEEGCDLYNISTKTNVVIANLCSLDKIKLLCFICRRLFKVFVTTAKKYQKIFRKFRFYTCGGGINRKSNAL